MANLDNPSDPLDLSEFYLNDESLEKTRALLGLPSYAEQLEKQAAGQTPINPLEAFGIVARPLESVTTAPTRAAVKALSEGGGLGEALQAAKAQAGKPPESAPTGADLARTLPLSGASPDLLGAGLDFALDPTHLIPGVAAMGALGSLKKVRTAAEIAADVEHLIPQSNLGFYSKLERTMAERLPEAGPVQPGQAKNLLQGIKADEISQTGIIPWLESKETFTREDLLKYLESQRLELGEVVRQADPIQKAYEATNTRLREIENRFLQGASAEGIRRGDAIDLLLNMNDAAASGSANLEARRRVVISGLPDSLRATAREFNELYDFRDRMPRASQQGHKYPKFQRDKLYLPGGENYQETVITLPTPKDDPAGLEARKRVFEEWQQRIDEARKTLESHLPGSDLSGAIEVLEKRRDEAADKVYRLKGESEQFKGGHWSEPNVLAHARTQEFKNTAGEKVFLVDELQSDWHQKGRDVGYKTKEQEALSAELKRSREASQVARQNWVDSSSKLNDYLAAKFGRGERLDTISTVLWRQGPTAPAIEQAAGRRNIGDATYDALFSDPEVSKLLSDARQKSMIFDRALIQERDIQDKVNIHAVPDAPFKKNWPELMLKRMVRQAIDSGADGIAITPGAIQADRYNLRKHVESIAYNGTDLRAWNQSGTRVFEQTGVRREDLPNYIGREAAERLLKNPAIDETYVLSGEDLEIGGEGMKAFYDQMLPTVLKDLGKKYGAKLEITEIISGNDKIKVPYLRFNDEMKQKVVKSGQPLYQAPVPIAASALLKEWVEKQREKNE